MRKIYFAAILISNILSAQSISLVKDIYKGVQPSNPNHFIKYQDKLFFTATTEKEGNEIWETDGTEEGTKLVKDVLEGSTSFLPFTINLFNNKLYISNLNGNGNDIPIGYYSYDGDQFKLVTAEISSVSSVKASEDYLFLRNDSNIFRMDKNENILNITNNKWTTYGHYAIMGDKLIMSLASVEQPDIRNQLYTYTEKDGIKLLKFIYNFANPQNFFYSSSINKVLFTANSEVYGSELWITDGTEEGTKLLKDLYVGSSSSYPESYLEIGNKIFFVATNEENGKELWVTDGTEEGTKIVKDINPNKNSSNPKELTELNGKLYFFANDGSDEAKLWETDGTEDGTKLTLALKPGYKNFMLGKMYPFNNELFVSAKLDVQSNQELYKITLGNLGTSETLDKENIIAYPNPVLNNFYIKNIKEASYKLYDFTGNLIQQGAIKNQESIQINSPSGIYLLQVYSKTGQLLKSTKIIKK